MAGYGRWQRALLDAVNDHEVVGLVGAVDRHLGRHGTRSELTAARRAAGRLASGGRLVVHRVRTQPVEGDAGGGFVVISQPGVALDQERLQQAARGAIPTADDLAGTEPERLAAGHQAVQAVASIEHAAVDARYVQVDHLLPETAARLADQLEPGLAELVALGQRLRRRSRPKRDRPRPRTRD